MISGDIEDLLKTMICLECGHGLEIYQIDRKTAVLLCKKCHAVYCSQEGVTTILPKTYLDKSRYESFISHNKMFWQKNLPLKTYFDKFTRSLSIKTKKWEDDDVTFWDAKYVKDCLELKTKRLVGRTYQRNQILFQPMRDFGTKNHRILEVGCGEAISAQKLLLPHGDDFLYIATDYSFQALKHLRIRLGQRKNVLYLQCLGNFIPFKDGTFDDIICLGVLHHMPKKEGHIPYLVKKLKPEGLLLINEPYDRTYRLPRVIESLIQKIIEPRQSAHEERVNVKKFRNNLKKVGTIILETHGHTPVKTVLIRITGSLYERSVVFMKFLLIIDKITEKTVGRVWKLFSAGDCLILFRKTK